MIICASCFVALYICSHLVVVQHQRYQAARRMVVHVKWSSAAENSRESFHLAWGQTRHHRSLTPLIGLISQLMQSLDGPAALIDLSRSSPGFRWPARHIHRFFSDAIRRQFESLDPQPTWSTAFDEVHARIKYVTFLHLESGQGSRLNDNH